jgi:hypothetical protein
MAKTITGSIAGTVTLVAGDDPVLVEPSGYVYGAPVGIYGGSGVPWTITNQGTITGTAPISTEIAAGIELMSGGSVDNSGTISGYTYGIYITGDLGTVSKRADQRRRRRDPVGRGRALCWRHSHQRHHHCRHHRRVHRGRHL